ncbi:MAG: NUDIX domain-containing protein [Bryobacterales bacterium]|nr:NUDIX domain-containing protein [Bryobacterales bacterium]
MSSDGGFDYNPGDYPPVAVTVDVALFAIRREKLHVLLIQRGIEPFAGAWALPGGFVQPDEGLDAAAARELAEETGVTEDSVYLEQLRSYGSPGRDPRMRVVTVAYWGACAEHPSPMGGSDAAQAELVPTAEIEDGDIELAFDHGAIVSDALERVRAKLEYTALAARFCASEFTISELRRVYEIIWNTKLDPGNFQRKVRENRSFRRVGLSAPPVLEQAAPDLSAKEVYFERAEEGWDPADGVVARAAMDSAWSEEVFQRVPSRPRTRSGRPASLWTANDSELTLNSPIPRRRASRKA